MPTSRRATPKWTKAPDALVALFNELHAGTPGIELRQMFGYPCAFVAGQMFTGLFQDSMMLRLSETDRSEFISLRKTTLFEPMPGRPMREYVVVPKAVLESRDELRSWVEKGRAYAAALGPKTARGSKKAGRSKAR
jgi:TfoX/Sxy family transcriptional regulator of competence genes